MLRTSSGAEGRDDAFQDHAGPRRCSRSVLARRSRTLLAAVLLSRAAPRDAADLGLGQESPLERLILAIGLAQRQGGSRLHQLIAEVERVRRVGDVHLLEEAEGIGVAEQLLLLIA